MAPPPSAQISSFVYRPAPGWEAPPGGAAAAPAAGPENAAATAGGAADASGSAMVSEAQARAREKAGWEQGFNEALSRERAEAELAAAQLREALAEALREFGRERDAYFHSVEGEVVALALAIVRKILRRESQLDPLLLSGIVRVALEKMAVTSNVRLRVHPSQIALWQEYLAGSSDLPVRPELMGDATLESNHCHLDSELGLTEINLESQLKEIEQGLFDLLAQRPAPR